VFGSGDCIEPSHVVERLRSGVSGVLVGRGVLRNPWILAQASDLIAGREPRVVSMADRGQFLLDYIDLLLRERVDEELGFRHEAPMTAEERARMHSGPAQGRERWVINKLRALNSWYTKGFDNGSHLRIAVNSATSIAELRDLIHAFFMMDHETERATRAALTAAARDVVSMP
jgi:tRNA-dihydrouridine synthase